MNPSDNFNTTITSFIVNGVLAPIQAYLSTTKGVNVSIEELQACLKIQATTPMSGMPVASSMLPSHLSGVAVAPIPPKKGRAKASAAVADPTGLTCRREVTRGAAKGNACGKKATHMVDGVIVPLCAACVQRKGTEDLIRDFLSNHGGEKSLNPPMVQSPISMPPPPVVETRKLKVTPIPDKTGMFVDTTYGFIITSQPNKSFTTDMISPSKLTINGDLRPLNQEEAKIAGELGLTVVAPATVSTTPAIPVYAGIPNVMPITNVDQLSESVQLA
jgi:hypothetical protein